MIDQTSARFIADAEELVSKHNKRWVGKHGLVKFLLLFVFDNLF